MKCIPECGYSEKPDNLIKLTRHLEDCLDSGACSKLKKEPFILWKNGEFTVSAKKTKKDQVFDVPLVRKQKLELNERQIKKASDYVSKVTITQGSVSDNLEKKPSKRVKAKIDEELQADVEQPVEEIND